MASDKIGVKILADGTVKSTTDEISAANHRQAESFMKFLQELMGGETDRARNLHGHAAHHHHGEERQHA